MIIFVEWLLYLTLATWFGSSLYFSTLAAPRLFAALPVDAAGAAVAALFPAFFLLSAILGVVSVVLYLWLRSLVPGPLRASRTAMTTLGSAALLCLINRFVLLPRVEAIEQKMGPISSASPADLSQFGMWHGISMLLDFLAIVLLAAAWFAVAMGTKPQVK